MRVRRHGRSVRLLASDKPDQAAGIALQPVTSGRLGRDAAFRGLMLLLLFKCA
jgi:hypothetical protein